MTDQKNRFTDTGLHWRVHVPNLMKEILVNPGTSMLAMPLRLLGANLHELAELAIKIDDPRLHLMMIDLALYEVGDLNITPLAKYQETRAELVRQCEAIERQTMGNLEDHNAEQAAITAQCEAGTCDHPDCKLPTWHQEALRVCSDGQIANDDEFKAAVERDLT